MGTNLLICKKNFPDYCLVSWYLENFTIIHWLIQNYAVDQMDGRPQKLHRHFGKLSCGTLMYGRLSICIESQLRHGWPRSSSFLQGCLHP